MRNNLIFDWLLERSDTITPINSQIPHSLEAAVVDAVESLGPYDRYILEAKFYERLSYRQLMERIGKNSPGATHYAVKRALKRLKKKLKEQGIDYDNY